MKRSGVYTLLAAVGLTGVATALTPGARAADSGTLVVALPGDIQRTDSALNDDTNSAYVALQVMQGLVGLKPVVDWFVLTQQGVAQDHVLGHFHQVVELLLARPMGPLHFAVQTGTPGSPAATAASALASSWASTQ